jgi:hypothetical protein
MDIGLGWVLFGGAVIAYMVTLIFLFAAGDYNSYAPMKKQERHFKNLKRVDVAGWIWIILSVALIIFRIQSC